MRGKGNGGMMQSQRTLIATICAGMMYFCLADSLSAQSKLEMTLRRFNNEEVNGYVQPMGDLLGANMNAGLYHSHRFGCDGIDHSTRTSRV
jgi:hypothetical protein